MTANNMWLGDNELVIVYRNGAHVVAERYEDWNEVFRGNYAECVAYCNSRLLDYEESIIG